MKKLLLSAFSILGLMACHSTGVIPLEGSVPNLDSKKVEAAISRGATERGWVAKSMGAGTMELTLQQRQHRLVVDVKYTATNYSINYKDSSNMNYDASSNTIHPKYNKWVNTLRHSIDRNLAIK